MKKFNSFFITLLLTITFICSAHTTAIAAEQTTTSPTYTTGIYNVDNQNAYYKNGTRQYTTDVIKINNTWYNLVNGVVTPNTVAKNSYGWWYIDSNGQVNFHYTGIASNQYGYWYCKNGKVQFITDVLKTTYNNSTAWYNIKNGKLTPNTVAKNSNGWWYIDSSGKVDFTANTVAKNSAGWWVIRNGKVNFNYNGIASNKNGNWYCKGGKVQFITDVVKTTYNNSTAWYNIKGGKLTTGPTVSKNSSGWWYIDSTGKVDFTFTGIATNTNGTWYCKGGKVQFGYSGTYTADGIKYTIKNGRVVSQESIYNHSWDSGVVTTSPTCTNSGVKTYTCTTCGATKTESIPATGHSWTENYSTRTVEVPGETVSVVYCIECNAGPFSTYDEWLTHGLAAGHGNYAYGKYTYPGTTTTETYATGRTCSVCGTHENY